MSKCDLIGMVHLLPLPGSPNWGGDMANIIKHAMVDAERLVKGGCDAIIVENMHDLPYLKGDLPTETVAAATLAMAQIVTLGLPTGLQLLAGANRQAISVASVCGAAFIRAEGFAYAHIADEGWIDACAGPLLRHRRALGASKIQVWADVQKKHSSHALTADLGMRELTHGAEFCGADALIVTGQATGSAAVVEDVKEAAHAGLPVYVGSGITDENLSDFAPHCKGVIVGSWLKEGGNWRRPVDLGRVKALRAILDA